MNKKIILTSFIIIIFTIFSASVINAATVSFFIGKVTVKDANAWVKAKVGMNLTVNSEIKTGKNALAIITLKRGSTIKLRENSSLKLKEEGAAQSENVSFELLNGSVFSKILKRKAGEVYNIRVGTIVVAVRGTEFFVAQETINKKRKDLWVCVNEGAINITRTTDKKSVVIPEGKGVLIKATNEFTPAKEYRWTRKLNWNMNPKKGTVVDQTDILKAYYDILDFDYD